jgi:hypothetical protein
MNPRGWVMDYLAACYSATAKWGPGPSDTFTMRWYHSAPGAKDYPYAHAFGTTVDRGCYGDDTPPVGEIAFIGPTWSPSGPPLYDGSSEPFYIPALLDGADPTVMAVPCVDGSITLSGTISTHFAPVLGSGGHVCECETAVGAIGSP